MRRPSLRLSLGLGIPLLAIIVLLAAWAVDTSKAEGKVPRNVTVAGRDVGGMEQAKLARVVGDVARYYESLPVQVKTGEKTYRIAAGRLGLHLDEAATARSAMDVGKDTTAILRPFEWLGSLVAERKASLRFSVDDDALAEGLRSLERSVEPVEPTLVPGSTGLAIVSGSPGRTVDPEGVREQLVERANSGDTPIVLHAEVVADAPSVTDAQAQALADRVNTTTANGMKVTAGTEQASFDARTVRSWLGSKVVDGKIDLTIDARAVTAALTKALPPATTARDASITLVDNTVKITPSVEGRECCGSDTADRILAAIDSGKSDVTVDLKVTKPSFTTEAAKKLGIKEPVGSVTEWKGQPQVRSFTTYYDCCAPRVTNIHRMADQVRGTLVKPGEKFSINAVVGKRTREKGYVEAGAIANGEHVQEVGGGVSQFATTMFNAAYFAGLQIDTYQAHSEHFDRYPRGREATMGYPAPDLAWTNNTPYGILVWTSYTDTSITITLWSTQWATAQQTGSTDSRAGRCTVVTTERTVTYPGGKTSKDHFTARYRDEGATSC
ncbi:MAG: VanW family protein [Acidimicrobiales bacterium]|nr:VanW family protein [Acidimicrobiales bacterium]